MDYEKRYKDALGWIEDIYPQMDRATQEDAEYYFPELVHKSDEDMIESIKGALIAISISSAVYDTYKEEISWLEKLKNRL